MPAFTQAALKAELADAVYAGKDDAQIAAALNDPAFSKAAAVDRGYLAMADVLGAVDWTEFGGVNLDATKRLTFQVLTNCDRLKITATTKAAFAAIFPNGGPSRTALLALVQKAGTRAEFLFGDGVVITPSQVSDARRA